MGKVITLIREHPSEVTYIQGDWEGVLNTKNIVLKQLTKIRSYMYFASHRVRCFTSHHPRESVTSEFSVTQKNVLLRYAIVHYSYNHDIIPE